MIQRIHVDMDVYKCRDVQFNEIFNILMGLTDKIFDKIITSKDINLDNNVFFGLTCIFITNIYKNLFTTDTTESKNASFLAISEDYYTKCLVLLHENKLHRKCIIPVLIAYTELGKIRKIQKDIAKSKIFSRKAVQLYLNFTKKKECPIDILYNVGLTKETYPEIQIQECYIAALRTLIEIYEEDDLQDLDKCEEYLLYRHYVVKTGLTMIQSCKDMASWVNECYYLIETLMKQERFTECRSHLAAVTHVFERFHTRHLNVNVTDCSELDCQLTPIWNNLNWASYGLKLLDTSKNRLLLGQFCKPFEKNTTQSNTSKSEKKPTKLLIFSELEKELKYYNDRITDNYLSDCNSAKVVFNSVLKWLRNTEKMCLNKSSLMSSQKQILNVTIKHNISAAYRHFTQYEKSKEKRIQWHKQHVKILKHNVEGEYLEDLQTNYLMFMMEAALTYCKILDEQIGDELLSSIPMNKEKIDEVSVSVVHILKKFQLFQDYVEKYKIQG